MNCESKMMLVGEIIELFFYTFPLLDIICLRDDISFTLRKCKKKEKKKEYLKIR